MANILIVDDQLYMRIFLSAELSEEGYGVDAVQDEQSLFAYLNNSRPDMVLLDLFLNGSKGWNLLKTLKTKDPDLPVVILTAYDGYQEDPRLSQADGYVIKSFTGMDGLKQKITRILQ